MGCECESLNGILKIDINCCMMMSEPSLARSQKVAVHHLTLED